MKVINNIEVFLIRHGKTSANEKRLYCGKSDLSLSEVGKKEINEIKDIVNYPHCDMYFTSGAKRANETFGILYPDVKYKVLNEFWEYDFGEFEMKSYDMLKGNEAYIKWISDKDGSVCCPNGESKKVYRKRITKAFNKLIIESFENKFKSIFLLCHGGTIGTILEIFYDDSKSFYEHQPCCGRGYKINIVLEKKESFKITEVKSI